MKLKDGFILREIAGRTVVLPTGDDLNLNMMITLNSTGKFLWTRLEQEVTEEELVAAVLAEYDVDEATAKSAVEAFIAQLNANGFLI